MNSIKEREKIDKLIPRYSDKFFSERSSLEPNIILDEFIKNKINEDENNLFYYNQQTDNGNDTILTNNKTNFFPYKTSNNKIFDFAKSNEINIKHNLLNDDDEIGEDKVKKNIFILNKDNSILFEEVISYNKSDVKAIYEDINNLNNREKNESSKLNENEKNFYNKNDFNISSIKKTKKKNSNTNNTIEIINKNFESNRYLNTNKNKIITPNKFSIYEYDDYYEFIKSNSDLYSGYVYDTNKFTNTNLGISSRNFKNNNIFGDSKNFADKNSQNFYSKKFSYLEKSLDSESDNKLHTKIKRSSSSSFKLKEFSVFNNPNNQNLMNNTKRTTNSEAESIVTKVIEDIKFEFNFYNEFFCRKNKRCKSNEPVSRLDLNFQKILNSRREEKKALNKSINNLDFQNSMKCNYSIDSKLKESSKLILNNTNEENFYPNNSKKFSKKPNSTLERKNIKGLYLNIENIQNNSNRLYDDSIKESKNFNSLIANKSNSNRELCSINISQKNTIDFNKNYYLSNNSLSNNTHFNFNKISDRSFNNGNKNINSKNYLNNSSMDNDDSNSIIYSINREKINNDTNIINNNNIFEKKIINKNKNRIENRTFEIMEKNSESIIDYKNNFSSNNEIFNNHISNDDCNFINYSNKKVDDCKTRYQKNYKKQIQKFNFLSQVENNISFNIIVNKKKRITKNKNVSESKEDLNLKNLQTKSNKILFINENKNNKIIKSNSTTYYKNINPDDFEVENKLNLSNTNIFKSAKFENIADEIINIKRVEKNRLLEETKRFSPKNFISDNFSINLSKISSNNIISSKFENTLKSDNLHIKNIESLVFIVIDDNVHLRNSIKNLLRLSFKNLKVENTIEIIEGSDGIDALKFVIDSNYNSRIKGLFIDENMEYMNGSEAIKIIRNFQKLNKINWFNIVTVTAFEDPVTRNNIIKAGVNEILQKPLSKHHLEEYFKRYPIN